MKVLFGQAYFLRFDPKLWEARQPYAPLGTLYAAACAREGGYDVALFDSMLAPSEEDWTAALDHHRPQFAVLYEDNFNYLTKMCLLRMREAAFAMIGAARARGITTIVSGSDATDHPSLYLDRGADVVIAGEGEATLIELLDVLAGRLGVELGKVPGIAFHDAAKRLVRTRPRQILRDIDALPLPAWDLVDVERYRDIWQRRHRYFSMNLATTRGCPFHCNWCAKPIYGQRYAVRAPERVVDEMLWLKATYRPDHLWIADDIFGLRPGWIERFAELVDRRDAAIRFKCLLRADQVTPETARWLRMAGCQTVWIGAESGSQKILDAMEKGIQVEQIVSATRLLQQAGIEVGFFLQFGYPGEQRADIERTLQMVRDCRPDDIGVSISYPLPGTPFYERVRAELGEKQNWVDSADLAMMFRATYSPAFYRALHALVHAEFRARKSGRAVTRALAGTRRLSSVYIHDAAACAYHAARVPFLRRRVDLLASRRPSSPPIVVRPVLSRQAAAMPTEQSQ